MKFHIILSRRFLHAFLSQDLTRQGYFRVQDVPNKSIQPQAGMRSFSRANRFSRLASLDIAGKISPYPGPTIASLPRGMYRKMSVR